MAQRAVPRPAHAVHNLPRLGCFFFLAARKPLAYVSFLSFTMWANLFHSLLMVVQALMHLDHYWSKFLTDIPFLLILAFGIYLWRPVEREDVRQPHGLHVTGGRA